MLKITKAPDVPRKSVMVPNSQNKISSLMIRRMDHKPFLSPEDKFLSKSSSRSSRLSRSHSKSFQNPNTGSPQKQESFFQGIDDQITDIDVTKEKTPILFYSEKDLKETVKRITKFQKIKDLEMMYRNSTKSKSFVTQKKISTSVPIRFNKYNPPSIYHKFYYKNLLVVDREIQHLNNAIFEVFQAEYNKETKMDESSEEKSSSSVTGEDFYNIMGDTTTYREQIPEEVEGEVEAESDEHETTSFGQTPQNDLQIRRLIDNSGKFLKLRKKTTVRNKFKQRLMGDKSLRQLFKVVDNKKKQLQYKNTLNERPYGAVEDPITMFYQGKTSMVSESLDSITSQSDENSSTREQELFTYETEKVIFAAPSLRKKRQKKPSKLQFTRNQSESVGFL